MHGTTSELLLAEEVSALALCNLVLHVLHEVARRLNQFGEHRDANERGGGVGEACSAEASHEEGLEEEPTCEDEPMCEDESMSEDDGEDMDDEDAGKERESPSSSGSAQESPCSTHCDSDRCCHPCSWAKQSESGNWEDGSFGEFSMNQDSGGKGESKAGHPPTPSSSMLCEQESPESPEVAGQAAPGETMSTVGNLPPAGSQDAVIIHATEDELRSLE